MKIERVLTSLFKAAAIAGMFASGTSLHCQATLDNPLSPAAKPGPAAPAQPPAGAQQPLTAPDLDAFLDGVVPFQLKRENIAGAVVLVVKDGKVLYQKGYGYADVSRKIPVTADGTLFRPGSISKLFTWTAVMQQVQAGKIDLNTDVNQYLDFKIPATYSKPITMWNLMTHTAGFEESIKDLISKGDQNPFSLHDYLVTHMPNRVYPPGTTPAYSNYGATLAGYIVQRVSGMPFNDYVEKNIFTPLGMTHTTFRQPIAAALQPMMSTGYTLGSGPGKPFEIVAAEPAGSSTTSATDIAQFMLAQLQNGEYNGVRILNPSTIAQMHSAQFAVDPALSHMCLGFYEETRNGHRIIGHAGDLQYFHSDLHLIQDENVGFFVSYNSGGRGEISPRTELFHAFLDRYFPYTVPTTSPQTSAVHDSQLIAGEYIGSRRPVTNVLSFFGFLSNPVVMPGKDGTISVKSFKGANQIPKIYEEIEPLLYREKGGQDRIGFTRDYNNKLVLSVDFPFEVYTKTSLADNKAWNFFLLWLVAIVCIGTLLWSLLSLWVRRHYARPLDLSRRERQLRVAMRIVLAIDLVFLLSWVILLASFGGNPLLNSSLDSRLRLLQVIGWLGTFGTLVILYAVVKLWRAKGEWWASHLGNISIAAAALSFSWFLLHWHLLNFSLTY